VLLGIALRVLRQALRVWADVDGVQVGATGGAPEGIAHRGEDDAPLPGAHRARGGLEPLEGFLEGHGRYGLRGGMLVEEGIPRGRLWKSVTDDAVCGAVQRCVKREKPEGLRAGKPR